MTEALIAVSSLVLLLLTVVLWQWRRIRKFRSENRALRRWVHARHVPNIRSVPSGNLKTLLQNGTKRFVLIGLVAFSVNASGQAILRTRYTTNTTPVIDVFVSAGGTNSRQFGTASLTNLSGNPNVATNILGAGTVTVTSNNAGSWTITGAAGTPGLTTNANQFLGTPLSIKTGAFQTNFNGWSDGTNQGSFYLEGSVFPLSDNTWNLGQAGSAFRGVYVLGEGVNLTETGGGSDRVRLFAPSSLAATFTLFFPDTQGGNGTTFTNNGSGVLGWWDAPAVIAQKQFGSANLTNWSNIPTGSMANVTSTTFLTNWANAVSNYVTASTNSASVTNWINSRQPASANLTNWSLIPTGEMANVVSTTFLTNWANAVSNYVTAATNSASVTNWINSRQAASANLTNWSLIPTGAMANVVSTDFLTNWANAISNLTQTKTALTTNGNQFGASVQLTIKDGALLTNVTLRGTTTILGPQTNSDMVNIAGGVTNWIGAETKGTLNASSNLVTKSGQSASNAWVGGLIWWSTAGFTNHSAGATTTNLATNIVAAHTLTNNGDAVHMMWRIKLANSAVNTNQFQIVYGSETVLDTGLQTCSNGTCQADLWITRTGNTAQNAQGRFEFGGSGFPFVVTNTNVELVQTNGIATIFQLRAAARRVGSCTNNWTSVWFDPAVR